MDVKKTSSLVMTNASTTPSDLLCFLWGTLLLVHVLVAYFQRKLHKKRCTWQHFQALQEEVIMY